MPPKEEPGYIEVLRKKTETLLKEVQQLQEAISPELARLEDQSQAGDQELSQLEHALTLKADGHFDLRISEDEMVCTADFYPPTPNGAPIDPDKVQERLHALGVVHGIDWEGISNALVACNIDRKEVLDVVVARGTPPTPEVPAHYVLEERFQQKKPLPIDSEERVDYRTLSPFTIVKKGDLVARLVPPPTRHVWTEYPGERGPLSHRTNSTPGRRQEPGNPGGWNLCHRGRGFEGSRGKGFYS